MRSTFPFPPLMAFARVVVLALVATVGCGAVARAQPGTTTVEIIGDSQAQGLAGALERAFLGNRQVHVLDRSRISTGLAWRTSYDWPRQARALAAENTANIVIVMFGANDRPPIRRHGVVDLALLAQFQKFYAERVREIIRIFRDAGDEVIWVGHPMVRSHDYSEDMAYLDLIFASVAAEAGARWVPTWDLFTTPQGGYTPYGKGIDGMTQRLRGDDGVHLTTAGYDVLAERLEKLIVARHAELTVGAAAGR